MHPIILLLAAAAGAYVLQKPKAPQTTVEAMIDPSERNSPNAGTATVQINHAVASNDTKTIAAMAVFIRDELKMPKTATNLQAWGLMIKVNAGQGGNATISGESEIGAARRRRALPAKSAALPDWLRFQATQSKLTGDPSHIRATAETMRRYGYRRAAEIHLEQID